MPDNQILRSPRERAQDDLNRIDTTIGELQEERVKVMNFLDMYDRYEVHAAEPRFKGETSTAAVTTTTTATAVERILKLPLNIRIGNFTAKHLVGKERPVPIGTIFDALQSAQLVPGGTNPRQAVSAILGKDKRFAYTLGEGWSLRPEYAPRQPTFQELGGVYKAP